MDTAKTSSKKFLFLSSIIFGFLFSLLFYLFKDNSVITFDTMVKGLPIYEYVSQSAFKTKDILLNYGVYFGGIFLLLNIILSAIILLISKIFTIAKYQSVVAGIMFLINSLFFALGFWLFYYEPNIMPISIGIILFIGKPLMYSAGIMLLISLGYFLKVILKKIPKLPNNIMMILMLLFLGGCVEGCSLVGTVMKVGCEGVEDSDHCYQKTAIANNDPSACDKIEFGPPRDKCHMMIAMNNGDKSICEGAEGVPGGYSQEFCEGKVGEVSTGSLVSSGSLTLEEEQKKKNDDFRVEIDKVYEEVGDGKAEGKEEEKREIKVEIAEQFNDYRTNNQDKSIEEWTKKINDIAIDVETMKRLDDNANILLDTMKSSMIGYVTSKTDEAKDAALEEGWSMVQMKTNTQELERRIKSLEGIKGAYDKASDSYNFINEKLEQIKKVKEEIEGIYKRMDIVDNMLQGDKIDAGQARVLKGAILLDEGLKNVTGYVPVFGSTISTISDETFNVVIKFASIRASRTHALNKCIADPLHCDANGISPY